MRILYVEDNPANLYLVKRVARAGEHEVINYIDGGEALQNLEHIAPDLILMDIQLAGEMTGLDVVRAIRAQGHTFPIIAVTAYAMVGDQERCIEAGCNDYMAKPLPIARLMELFEHYSRQTTEKASTAQPEAEIPPDHAPAKTSQDALGDPIAQVTVIADVTTEATADVTTDNEVPASHETTEAEVIQAAASGTTTSAEDEDDTAIVPQPPAGNPPQTDQAMR